MKVIQFPSPKDPLDFDGMGIKIEVEGFDRKNRPRSDVLPPSAGAP